MIWRRSIWLWAFSLWALGLGTIGIWRGIVLWRERTLLFELGSSLSSPVLTLFVSLSAVCGAGLVVSATGLWLRHDWARQSTRICIPAYMATIQTYTWLFVRSGLMWERRWVALIGAMLGTIIGIGALTWPRSRKWLGLR